MDRPAIAGMAGPGRHVARDRLGLSRPLLITAMLGLLCACHGQDTRTAGKPEVDDNHAAAAALVMPLHTPAGPAEIPTTRGDLFTQNIEAQLQTLRDRADRDPQWRKAYVGMLYFHTRLTGRVQGFDECQRQMDRLLDERPDDVDVQLLAAGIASAMHRFGDTEKSLLKAEQLGADAARLAEARSQLSLARGNTPAALLQAEQSSANTLTGLAYQGNLAVLRGDLAEAERLFARSELRHRGSSPFPLAWLHVQHGIALLRNEELERARTYFEAAHQRLPSYSLATEHLAETELSLGNAERARQLYEDVLAQTGNPEFQGQLAKAKQALGLLAEAKRDEAAAKQGWQQLLSGSPQAYWQHAAKFYLDTGDGQEAVRLARLNIELRQDVGSWLLLAETEQAAGNQKEACEAWRQATTSGLNPPELATQSDAFRDCRRG